MKQKIRTNSLNCRNRCIFVSYLGFNHLTAMYSKEQIEKIGNTIIFLSSEIKDISKTKLLKLLYILDEISIKKFGIPFLNLNYKVWKFGPVDNDIFIELSSKPSILKEFIERKYVDDNVYIIPKKKFVDDEFSLNELDLMKYVVEKIGHHTANELIKYTHRKNMPWYNAAVRNKVLDLLLEEKINSTDIAIDMSELVKHDERKESIYQDYLENC